MSAVASSVVIIENSSKYCGNGKVAKNSAEEKLEPHAAPGGVVLSFTFGPDGSYEAGLQYVPCGVKLSGI